MPSKKKKFSARFPAGRIKKIMQTDEEIGKVAQAVPIIISRTLELFVESLLTKTVRITNTRNAKTLSPSHLKQCIMSDVRFDFLRELVKNVPDISMAEESADNVNNSNESLNLSMSLGGTNGNNDKSNNLVPAQIASNVETSLQTFHQQFSPQAIEPTASTFYGVVDNKASMPLSSNSNSMNFYTEIQSPIDSYCDKNQPAQQQPQLKRASTSVPPLKKLPKLTRLNSAPSTITSNQHQPNFYNNTNVSSSSNPSTPQFTISIPSNHHEIELTEPIIKLDYSHLSFQQPQTTYSPPTSQYTSSTSTSSLFNNNFNQTQQPTIKIDFSNLNTLNNKASTGPAATSASIIANPWFQQQPQSGHQSTNGLDEDYDDI